MPLKHTAALAGQITQPLLAHGMAFGVGIAPADFLDWVAGDRAAQGLAHQLAAQAVPDDRDSGGYCGTNQRTALFDPRQGIVDAHRATHEA